AVIAASASTWTSAAFDTSVRNPITWAPCDLNSATVLSSESSWTSASTSFMPSDAPIRANSLPNPEAPPVITATLLSNCFMKRLPLLVVRSERSVRSSCLDGLCLCLCRLHLVMLPREMHVDGTRARVLPADRDHIGGKRHEHPGHRVLRVVSWRNGHRITGGESAIRLDRRVMRQRIIVKCLGQRILSRYH